MDEQIACYIDFSDRENLTTTERKALYTIQKLYKPIERVDFLLEYMADGKLTNDDFEYMTGLPYTYITS